ncbi:hypothetical protein VP01_1327g1 [Puccinia sorghi]|uniref:Uncharacterized protein n=1 Tax=Puccinia sorghi TaxID=27349 RepID=A0A0L6VMR8_9BASI|nr:hypothetical protein VP01_1327g1 [Puccinia sorghi]
MMTYSAQHDVIAGCGTDTCYKPAHLYLLLYPVSHLKTPPYCQNIPPKSSSSNLQVLCLSSHFPPSSLFPPFLLPLFFLLTSLFPSTTFLNTKLLTQSIPVLVNPLFMSQGASLIAFWLGPTRCFIRMTQLTTVQSLFETQCHSDMKYPVFHSQLACTCTHLLTIPPPCAFGIVTQMEHHKVLIIGETHLSSNRLKARLQLRGKISSEYQYITRQRRSFHNKEWRMKRERRKIMRRGNDSSEHSRKNLECLVPLYHPDYNKEAEKFNWTLSNMVRTTLNDSQLTKNHWNYLQILDSSPLENLYKFKPKSNLLLQGNLVRGIKDATALATWQQEMDGFHCLWMNIKRYIQPPQFSQIFKNMKTSEKPWNVVIPKMVTCRTIKDKPVKWSATVDRLVGIKIKKTQDGSLEYCWHCYPRRSTLPEEELGGNKGLKTSGSHFCDTLNFLFDYLKQTSNYTLELKKNKSKLELWNDLNWGG